ncbi:uncharacterized protein MELLADRAFT_65995 [Melampsora larici-populina 98AG31]|uniref:Uncharacterized protein n=1 Tax=Melampsora larici-populina (strain 98AG31 / pathotype 3-4-7) TaxID=747676 RepID=F4RXH0_MELLP|nr:uncharacterized protein MELLADRAFT_65995 [Melampsora larici-populina 98AG31]EGG02988.1 hypothetical protein MELLADRAFT_65995 [Melampsora larici-populina 98AG31]
MTSGRRSQRLIEKEIIQNYSELPSENETNHQDYNDELDADGETNEEDQDQSNHQPVQSTSSFTCTSNIDPQLFNQTVDHPTSTTSTSIKLESTTDELSLIRVAFNEFSKTLLQFSLGKNHKYPTLIDH